MRKIGVLLTMDKDNMEVKDVDDYPSSMAGKPRERLAHAPSAASFCR